MKICGKCRELKENSEFHKSAKLGLQSYCKKCNLEYNKSATVGRNRAAIRHRLHGLSDSEFQDLKKKQDNKCALCGKEKRLIIDHDHSCCPGLYSCGYCIRGLVCYGCNIFIGHLESNLDILKKALDYLPGRAL